MSDDVISRQAAIDAVDVDNLHRGIVEALQNIISELPSAEPKRRKGRWQITDAYPHNVYCSECHVKFAQKHWAVWEDGSLPRNFCPNCGAEMTEVENEKGEKNDTDWRNNT
jgi:hypothetical protein